MADRADLNMQRQLLDISRVREALARANWQDAESFSRQCEAKEEEARERATLAYDSWAMCVGSNLLGPGIDQCRRRPRPGRGTRLDRRPKGKGGRGARGG